MNSFSADMPGAAVTQTSLQAQDSAYLEKKALVWNNLGKLAIFLMPLVGIANEFSLYKIGDLSIHGADVLFVAGWVCLLFFTVAGARIDRKLIAFVFLILAYFAIISLGQIFISTYQVDWPKTIRFLQTISWGGLAVTLFTKEQDFAKLRRMVIVSTSAIAAISLYAYATTSGLQRIAGFFSAGGNGYTGQANFNEVGALFALSLILLIHRMVSGDKVRRSRFITLVGVLLLNFIGLVLTGSRSAMLALAASFMLLPFLFGFRRRYIVIVLGVLAFLLFAWSAFQGDLTLDRFSDTFNLDSNAYVSMITRFDLWDQGYQLWTNDPSSLFFGIGSRGAFDSLRLVTTDDFFLDHLTSEGLFGLIVILSLVVWPVLRVLRRGKAKLSENAALLALAVALVVSITGNVLVDPYYGGITFLVLYGFAAAYEHRSSTALP